MARNRQENLWKYEEDAFLVLNYEELGAEECGRLLNRSKWSIYHRVSRDFVTLYGLPLKFRVKPKNCDETFFDIWTKESAYCYGLLLSDGCLQGRESGKARQRPGYRAIFVTTDVELAEVFASCVRGKIRSESRERQGWKTLLRVRMEGRHVYERLWGFGLRPRKSCKEQWPTLPSSELYWHFIRGYFDGDGCVSFNTVKGRKYLMMDFLGGLEGMENLKRFLEESDIKTNKVTSREKKTVVLYRLAVTKREALKILSTKMYYNSEGLRLSRKYNCFKEHFGNEIP